MIRPRRRSSLSIKVSELLLHSRSLKKLESLYRKAKHAYYNGDTPIMSDAEFDKLEERLKQLNPKSKHLKLVGAPPPSERKINLPYVMPSLDKVKDSKSVDKWIKGHAGPFIISDKLDGSSALLWADRAGKLRMATRGNGSVGTDISALINNIKPRIQSLPKGITAVRGEIVMAKTTFAKKYASKFANSRNLTNGIVLSLGKDGNAGDLHFYVHQVVHPKIPLNSVKSKLESAGLIVVPHEKWAKVTESKLQKFLQKRKQQSKVDIDGLVISTSKASIAYKAGYEVAEGTVKKVEWSESKYGYLKPVILLTRPVKLSGVNIQKLSGHNAWFVTSNKIGPGAVIEFVRAGDTIPKVLRTIKESSINPLPSNIKFEWNSTGIDIIAKGEHSDDRITKLLTQFLVLLEVDKIKESTVSKLVAHGINTIGKLIRSEYDDFIAAGVGPSAAANLESKLESRLKSVSLPVMMAASGIFDRGFGVRRFELILNNIKYPNQIMLYAKNKHNFKERVRDIPGIGDIIATQYTRDLPKFDKFIKSIRWKPAQTVRKHTKVSGLGIAPIVVFTGFRDKALENQIKNVGGRIGSSVTKETTYVVVLSEGSVTTKSKRASILGIPVISVGQLKKKLKQVR